MYVVYALYSDKYDKIYVGYTSDLEQRLLAHNHPNKKGWTRLFRPWKLIYEETAPDKSAAQRREKQLKTAKGRAFVRSLIGK